MRLGGQAKAGFYPANPVAIHLLTKHLRLAPANPDKPFNTFNIIDPCAGKGFALEQIRSALDIRPDRTYAIELDAGRAEEIKQNVPGIPKENVLGPASFLGAMVTGYSFGLVYCNPPFDTELGGGRREEQIFAEKAIGLACPHGVVALVLPINAIVGNRKFVDVLDSRLEDIAVYKFPDGLDSEGNEIRPYREIVIIGRRRRNVLPADALEEHGDLHKMYMQYGGYVRIENLPPLGDMQPTRWNSGYPSYERETMLRMWEVPAAWKPNTFKKTAFTEDELIAAVENSPLNRIFQEVTIRPPASPPLPLDKGHLGLILASGMLDGVVEGPHGPHVVRGSSHKVEYYNKEASESTENPDTGAVTTKDVYSERMVTVIRCVEQDGIIYTHSNDPTVKEEAADEGSDDHGDMGIQPGTPEWEAAKKHYA